MFPFMYYIDCEGDLWVPCTCAGTGSTGGTGAAAGSIEIAAVAPNAIGAIGPVELNTAL